MRPTERKKPPFLPFLIQNSHLQKFINYRPSKKVENRLCGGDFKAWRNQTCEYRTSSGRIAIKKTKKTKTNSNSRCEQAVEFHWPGPFQSFFCSVLAVSTPHMATPAENRYIHHGRTEKLDVTHPGFSHLQQFLALFILFHSSKRSLESSDRNSLNILETFLWQPRSRKSELRTCFALASPSLVKSWLADQLLLSIVLFLYCMAFARDPSCDLMGCEFVSSHMMIDTTCVFLNEEIEVKKNH